MDISTDHTLVAVGNEAGKIAAALDLAPEGVARILDLHRRHDGDAPPDPRFLAHYHAAQDPAVPRHQVPRIILAYKLLKNLEGYIASESSRFVEEASGEDPSPEVEARVGARQTLLKEAASRLGATRSRRDVDDLLRELRWHAEHAEAPAEPGAELDLEVTRWTAQAGVRQQLRTVLTGAGVLQVRPAPGRPDLVVPARLASIRRPVQELSAREVRELSGLASEAGLELCVTIDEERLEEIVRGGAGDEDAGDVHDQEVRRRGLGLLLPDLSRELCARLVVRANRREVEAVGEAYAYRLDSIPIDEEEILAIDPGYGGGCRIATVRLEGEVQDHGTFELIGAGIDVEQTTATLRTVLEETDARVIGIAVGEGHQELMRRVREALEVGEGEESEDPLADAFLVDGLALDAAAGAPPLRQLYPKADNRLRRAIAIGRRLLAPFRAWSEVDPRAIASAYDWTGLDPSALARQLDHALREEVAARGLNLNEAPEPLLARIPGLDRNLAAVLVRHREEVGPFSSVEDIADLELMDQVTFERVAGFLWIDREAADPVQATCVHPRDRDLASSIIHALPRPLAEIRRATLTGAPVGVDLEALARETGSTVVDVEAALEQLIGRACRHDPDRDPAEESAGLADEAFEDLVPGMEVRGTVGDLISYGAFIDVGAGTPALLHISELAERYVPDPKLIVRTGDEVVARVLSVSEGGDRVAISLRRDTRPGKAAPEPNGSARTRSAPPERKRATRRPRPARPADGAMEHYPEIGDIIHGRVQRVVDYGAFVDFGLGRAGLLHRSQMDDDPDVDPHRMLAADDPVVCRVIESDARQGRIGLSIIGVDPAEPGTFEVPGASRPDHSSEKPIRRAARSRPPRQTCIRELDSSEELPSLSSFEDLEPEMVVQGKVTKTVSYGIFLDLGIDAPALIHISEIADVFVRNPGALVRTGDVLRARVLRINREERSAALTLRREDSGILPR